MNADDALNKNSGTMDTYNLEVKIEDVLKIEAYRYKTHARFKETRTQK